MQKNAMRTPEELRFRPFLVEAARLQIACKRPSQVYAETVCLTSQLF